MAVEYIRVGVYLLANGDIWQLTCLKSCFYKTSIRYCWVGSFKCVRYERMLINYEFFFKINHGMKKISFLIRIYVCLFDSKNS